MFNLTATNFGRGLVGFVEKVGVTSQKANFREIVSQLTPDTRGRIKLTSGGPPACMTARSHTTESEVSEQ